MKIKYMNEYLHGTYYLHDTDADFSAPNSVSVSASSFKRKAIPVLEIPDKAPEDANSLEYKIYVMASALMGKRVLGYSRDTSDYEEINEKEAFNWDLYYYRVMPEKNPVVSRIEEAEKEFFRSSGRRPSAIYLGEDEVQEIMKLMKVTDVDILTFGNLPIYAVSTKSHIGVS